MYITYTANVFVVKSTWFSCVLLKPYKVHLINYQKVFNITLEEYLTMWVSKYAFSDLKGVPWVVSDITFKLGQRTFEF